MNEAFHLYRLQKVDTQIDQASNRMAEISRLLSEDTTLQVAETAAQDCARKFDSARQALKKLEDQTEAIRIKIELNNNALYGGKVRNPKELQDLQNEQVSLKKHLATVEDQQIDAMLATEQAEQDHQAAQDLLTRVRADFTSRSAGLSGEQSTLKREVEKLRAEREPISNQIPPETLAAYDRLRRMKRGVAVAAIVDETCTACGSEISPAEWQAARSPSKITYCSSCGRILYAG